MRAGIIRNVKLSDAGRIAEIYNYYIKHTIITFEEDTVDVDEIERRIKSAQEKNYPYIVYEKGDVLCGYAYLSNWRARSAYNKTLETSIYLDINHIKKGIGNVLYRQLIEESRGISIQKLHEKLGFQLVGVFKESGLKFNQWIDVECWQLFL